MLWISFTNFRFPSDPFPFYINGFHLIESDVTDDVCSFWIWTSDPQEGIFSVTLSKIISIKSLVQLEFNLLYQLPLSRDLTLKKSNFPQDFIIPFTFFFYWMNFTNSWKKRLGENHSSQGDRGSEPVVYPLLSHPPLPFTCQLGSAKFHGTFPADASLQSTLKKGKRKVLAGSWRKGWKWRQRQAEKIK